MGTDNRGRRGASWNRVRRYVLARDGGVCQIRYPGICTTIATQVDHIRTLANGGDPENPANLRASCAACNQARPKDHRTTATRRW